MDNYITRHASQMKAKIYIPAILIVVVVIVVWWWYCFGITTIIFVRHADLREN